jgi:multicomponent Na+:H+ antiporter subunit G
MNYLGWALIFSGMFFLLSGIIALFRFPGFYAKIHASSVIECCGGPLCFIGLALLQDDYTSSFKLLAITILILIMNPVSTHALGRASILFKIDKEGRIK